MEHKAVIVVGAGASAEFGLPVGSALAQKVALAANEMKADQFGNQLSGDADLFSAISQIARKCDCKDFIQELRKVSAGVLLAPSIDNYLHAHCENEFRVKLGKLLIAYSLLQAEKDSTLYFDPSNSYSSFDFSKVSDTWLSSIFRSLMTVGSQEQLSEKLRNITFVSFNYDRVIHRFFFLALQQVFDLSQSESSEFCDEFLTVLHPYGSLGELKASNSGSGYGEIFGATNLVAASETVNVFTEGGERHTRQLVRQALVEATSVWFLGFSFLSLNMEYLKPTEKISIRVFGTNRGLSDYNFSVAEARIASWVENGSAMRSFFRFFDCNCSQLVSDYSDFWEPN